MLCSVKKQCDGKIYCKTHRLINLNIPLFKVFFSKCVVVKFWGGFIAGVQIYKERDRS